MKCFTCGNIFEKDYITQKKCKPCKREYDNQYYKKLSKEKKDKKNNLNKQNRIEKRQYLWDYLKENPCCICGEKDPVVLEFDHLDQTTKINCVSLMVYNSLDKIKKEIEKCQVLCANCHKRRTASQLNWHKDLDK
jgi:hypothetical protein